MWMHQGRHLRGDVMEIREAGRAWRGRAARRPASMSGRCALVRDGIGHAQARLRRAAFNPLAFARSATQRAVPGATACARQASSHPRRDRARRPGAAPGRAADPSATWTTAPAAGLLPTPPRDGGR
ncbi:hypothetical protein PRJ39_08635 [Lysobacter enzymogenes]|uniref:hypothetical protein n=1 Tax=Lysobacter enzymogenes TaxID=69 RepID=UPI0037484A6F